MEEYIRNEEAYKGAWKEELKNAKEEEKKQSKHSRKEEKEIEDIRSDIGLEEKLSNPPKDLKRKKIETKLSPSMTRKNSKVVKPKETPKTTTRLLEEDIHGIIKGLKVDIEDENTSLVMGVEKTISAHKWIQ